MRCLVYRGVGGREVAAPSKSEFAIAPRFAGVNPAGVLHRVWASALGKERA